MAEIRLDSHPQNQARRAVGFTSQHDRGGTPKRKIIFAADQNFGRSFPMGRKTANWFGAPLVNVPGTI